jgi:uncharacterized protein with HEPN domain
VKDDRLHLLHIRECIDRIERYTQDGKDQFLTDTKTQDAVLRNLHTLAESTQQLSAALKSTHPNIDWRNIAAFRNVVVHGYLGVSLTQIWDIVEQDVPQLKGKIEVILHGSPPGNGAL